MNSVGVTACSFYNILFGKTVNLMASESQRSCVFLFFRLPTPLSSKEIDKED
jgi:hypothetical protein